MAQQAGMSIAEWESFWRTNSGMMTIYFSQATALRFVQNYGLLTNTTLTVASDIGGTTESIYPANIYTLQHGSTYDCALSLPAVTATDRDLYAANSAYMRGVFYMNQYPLAFPWEITSVVLNPA